MRGRARGRTPPRTDLPRGAAAFAIGAGGPPPDVHALPPRLATLCLEVAVGALFAEGRAAEAVAADTRLLALTKGGVQRRAFHVALLLAAGDRDAADTLLDELMLEAPDDEAVRTRQMHVLAARGDVTGTVAAARALVPHLDGASPVAVNNVAWYLLFGDADDIRAARRLCDEAWAPEAPHPELAHTRAMACALDGDLLGALDAWRAALPDGGDPFPIPAWTWLHGRLAEALGLADEARAAYGRVPRPEGDGSTLTTAAFADQRLALLRS